MSLNPCAANAPAATAINALNAPKAMIKLIGFNLVIFKTFPFLKSLNSNILRQVFIIRIILILTPLGLT
jgi:hypothetical protein